MKFPGRPHDVFSYSGALIVFLGVTCYRSKWSVDGSHWASIATIASALWCEHFVRRVIECLTVHRYANRQVPLSDALGEYLYYWGFGVWNAVALSSRGSVLLDVIGWLGLLTFVTGEIGNAWAHWKLRALRRPNTDDRGIPEGGLFKWVSCANYTYELIAWAGFCILTRTLASVVYLAGIALVLGSWAWKRHKRYHEYFDGKGGRPRYPSERRAFIPFVF